jgi:hypothetical protein
VATSRINRPSDFQLKLPAQTAAAAKKQPREDGSAGTTVMAAPGDAEIIGGTPT